MILVLSTLPCFMEDRCIEKTYQIIDNQQQNGDSPGMEYCSPFFSCNSCTGFVVTVLHFSVEHLTKQPEKKLCTVLARAISDFPFSIWHPPKLV